MIQQELQDELEDPMLDLRRMTDSTVGDGYGGNSTAVGVGQTSTSTVSMIRRLAGELHLCWDGLMATVYCRAVEGRRDVGGGGVEQCG